MKIKITAVGAGLDGGFNLTGKLNLMKFKETMNGPDSYRWDVEIENERTRMVTNSTWEPLNKKNLPEEAKVIASRWACKKKSNGSYHGRLNARGF